MSYNYVKYLKNKYNLAHSKMKTIAINVVKIDFSNLNISFE